jgi:hypothetical protein
VVRRHVLLLAALLLPGCRQLLDIPSDVSAGDGEVDGAPGAGDEDAGNLRDGGGGVVDGAPGGGDGGACVTTSVQFDFPDASALVGWRLDRRPPDAGCMLVVENERLTAYRTGPPVGSCTASRELGLDMTADSSLQVTLAEPGSEQLSMTFSMILSDGSGDIQQRQKLQFIRDDGALRFLGDCTEKGCTQHGSLVFDQSNHARWRFVHDSAAGAVYFEVAPVVGAFTRPDNVTAVEGIDPDLVRCVGVELGNYEDNPATSGTAAFDDLSGGPNLP